MTDADASDFETVEDSMPKKWDQYALNSDESTFNHEELEKPGSRWDPSGI